MAEHPDFIALLLDETVLKRIAAAVEEARQHVRPLGEVARVGRITDTQVLTMAERARDFPPATEFSAVSVPLPFTFRANVSFEEQPIGLCIHLSISVGKDATGEFRMPSQKAFIAVAQAFGLAADGSRQGMSWVEEFEPGHFAVNLVEKVDARGCH